MELIRTEELDGKQIQIFYDGPVVTRKEAIAAKESRYFEPDKICIRNHVSQRYVQSGACIACQIRREYSRRKRKPVQRPGFIVDQRNSVNYTRAVMAAYGYKPFTVQLLRKHLAEIATEEHQQSEGATTQFMAICNRKGFLEKLGNRGRFMQYRCHPQFYYDTRDMVKLLCELNPDHAGAIEANYKKALDDYGKTAEVLESERAEDQALQELEDFKLEETPIALMGRAIVEYINRLRDRTEYDITQAKIGEMKRTISNFRTKNDMLAGRVKDYATKNDKLTMENHKLKMENQKFQNQLEALQTIVRSRASGHFSVGEIAKIKSLLGEDFLKGLPGAIAGQIQ